MITKSLSIGPLKTDHIEREPAEKEHPALGPLRQGTTLSTAPITYSNKLHKWS